MVLEFLTILVSIRGICLLKTAFTSLEEPLWQPNFFHFLQKKIVFFVFFEVFFGSFWGFWGQQKSPKISSNAYRLMINPVTWI